MAGPYTEIPTTGNVRANDLSPTDARVLINAIGSGLYDLETLVASLGPGGGLGWKNVKDYGAQGDGKYLTTWNGEAASMLAGSNVVTSDVSDQWTSADVGKKLWIEAAGPANGDGVGTPLYGTITGYNNPKSVTLNVTATTTVSGGSAYFATDDTAAINDAIADLDTGDTLYFPPCPGWMSYHSTGNHVLPQYKAVTVRFAQPGITRLMVTSLTANGFTARSDGCKFINASLENPSCIARKTFYGLQGAKPTAGTAFGISDDAVPHVVGVKFIDCLSNGFYRGGHSRGIASWARCAFWGSVDTGVLVQNNGWPDYGGGNFVGCYWSAPATCGSSLRFESGSALHVDNCWFNGSNNSILLLPSQGDLSQIGIKNSAFEDWGNDPGYAIFGYGGGGILTKNIVIANNNFGAYVNCNPATDAVIKLDAGTGAGWTDSIIIGNTSTLPTSYGISVKGGNRLTIRSGNQWRHSVAATQEISCSNIS